MGRHFTGTAASTSAASVLRRWHDLSSHVFSPADSVRPRVLFETGLPVRYYLPKLDVRVDLLRPSDTTSVCPYKGTAHYWSVQLPDRLVDDIVWFYPAPIPEIPKIEAHLCFFNEKVDIVVDGVRQERPVSPWS